jgi:excisionase family DNA binding protein
MSDFDAALVEALVRLIDARIDAALAAFAERADTAEPPGEFLNVAECAELLRCSRQRVYDVLSAGGIPRVKEGSRTLVRRSDVDRYLQDGGERRRG